MEVRTFLDEHSELYSDVPKLTAADVHIEDLHIVRTDKGIFAIHKNGAIFKNRVFRTRLAFDALACHPR